MPAFFLTFIAVAAAMLAGRDAVRVARLKASLGWTAPLLVIIFVAALLGAALAAWIAGSLAPLIAPSYKPVVVAVALGLAGLELLLRSPPAKPREPTRSMGAITLVLLLGMVTDASGFIILSMAIATGELALAAAGGATAAIAVLVAALVAAEDWDTLPLDPVRRIVAAALILAAVVIVLVGRNLIG
ncbi:hypothetical protein [Aurantiacibacter gangjinensis]|uniref:hypothetical protein n=1 Tax=Aurantiacibacter gangjinensis TaxID=502682 RepID=UPI00069AE425|nr:hypothetical protein [Aurantiacibacter gangjinensis]APE27954.1 putative transmembrane protein [Aurantiacibacter gangjinensis]